MSAERGSIIGFASELNTVAYESKGNYSYFTEALAREIVKAGASITQVLRRVRVALQKGALMASMCRSHLAFTFLHASAHTYKTSTAESQALCRYP